MSSQKMKILGLLVLVLALVGCNGNGNKETAEPQSDAPSAGVLLATVGDVEIRSAYYEDRLALLEEKELPKGDDGKPVDMLTMEGKKKFIEVLVNKELMVLEARNEGYHERHETIGAYNALLANEADMLLWAAVEAQPMAEPTPEEIDAIYAQLGKERLCQFVITNLKEDAVKAREMALGGADWADVVAKYHDGSLPPDGGIPEVSVPFGRYSAIFDAMVYDTEVGDVSQPTDTGTGIWMVKVMSEKMGDKPSRAEAVPMIKDLIKRRNTSKMREDYRARVDAEHKMVINEEALLIAFNGLPEGEGTLDPVTKQPLDHKDLLPMTLDPAHAGMELYSYEIDGVTTSMTLGEYKKFFDASNVFVRPKESGMLGGMRGKIIQDMEKVIMANQAKMDGLLEDPGALATVKNKIDQIITMALFKESVVIDEEVSEQDRIDFWAEHSAEYFVPEVRLGLQVICRNKELAEAAAGLAKKGETWDIVMARFDTDQENKVAQGRFQVTGNDDSPLKDAVFALVDADEVSEPFALGNGKYGVVKLDRVYARRDDVAMEEIQESMDARILGLRQEAAFQEFLGTLRDIYPVVVHDENLADLKGWKELSAARLAAEGPTTK